MVQLLAVQGLSCLLMVSAVAWQRCMFANGTLGCGWPMLWWSWLHWLALGLHDCERGAWAVLQIADGGPRELHLSGGPKVLIG